MEEAPQIESLDTSNPDDIARFLAFWDKYVSTWHPDKSVPPAAIHPSAQLFATLQDTKLELAEMLNCFQHHRKCQPGYCKRRKKETGETFCCFGSPKKCREQSDFIKEAGQDFAEFHTKCNDEILNSHNPGFILGWRANIDFHPVINKEAVIAYVAKYASKGETTSSSYEQTLQAAISWLKDDDAAGIAYQKMLSTFSSEHDISGKETCHILLGCSLVENSRIYRSLHVSPTTQEAVDFGRSSTEHVGLVE